MRTAGPLHAPGAQGVSPWIPVGAFEKRRGRGGHWAVHPGGHAVSCRRYGSEELSSKDKLQALTPAQMPSLRPRGNQHKAAPRASEKQTSQGLAHSLSPQSKSRSTERTQPLTSLLLPSEKLGTHSTSLDIVLVSFLPGECLGLDSTGCLL